MINRLLRNDFVKNNGLLFIAGLLTGAVNYALYPVISRVVSIEQFGEVQILLALVTQLSVFGAVVRIFVVNTLKDESDPQVASQFIRNTMRTLAITASGIALLLLAISPWLQSALQFNSIWGLVPTAFNFVLGLLFMVPLAFIASSSGLCMGVDATNIAGFYQTSFRGAAGLSGFWQQWRALGCCNCQYSYVGASWISSQACQHIKQHAENESQVCLGGIAQAVDLHYLD